MASKKTFLVEPKLQSYSPKVMIEGVKVIKYPVYASEGGDFAEYLRIYDDKVTLGRGDSLVEIEGFKPRQISRSFMPTGLVKAWHLHKKQNEIFFPTDGRFLIALYDNRIGSKSKGVSMRIYSGKDSAVAVYIPHGVAHGYMNVGSNDALLIYATDQHWDGTDEWRIPWNNKTINFDWTIPNE
ncbi:dTDP-4-dehydrorhamnose 3,5-epimerase family protein [Candidatus Dojkabacteria bacterium]|uniref:dTDP-4-dehydrorhamnose 3,5-epimerase family protein n=1 Tax=Candidatus Dojkabacteria bacterium TaxID=2099670 RepID=A0A955L400_9BACT|nr:dTDP-4-dehydrorhamnose 3,5-epimerase family protein [Candidatus Dojkabacteria bacterium]